VRSIYISTEELAEEKFALGLFKHWNIKPTFTYYRSVRSSERLRYQKQRGCNAPSMFNLAFVERKGSVSSSSLHKAFRGWEASTRRPGTELSHSRRASNLRY
jgi:hypothetical protein